MQRKVTIFLVFLIVLSAFSVVVFSLPIVNKLPFYDFEADGENWTSNDWWTYGLDYKLADIAGNYYGYYYTYSEQAVAIYVTNDTTVEIKYGPRVHLADDNLYHIQYIIKQINLTDGFYVIYTTCYKTDDKHIYISVYNDEGAKVQEWTGLASDFTYTEGEIGDWAHYTKLKINNCYASKKIYIKMLSEGESYSFTPLFNALDWILYSTPKIKVIRIESYTSPVAVQIYSSNGSKFYEQGFSGNITNPEITYIFANDTKLTVFAYGPAGSKSVDISENGLWIVKLNDTLTNIYLNQTETSNETATGNETVSGSAQLGIYVKKVWWDWTKKQYVDGWSNKKVVFLYANGTRISTKYTDNSGFTGLVQVPANTGVKVKVYYEENKYEERSYKLKVNETLKDTFTFLTTNEGVKRGNIIVVRAEDTSGNPLSGVHVEIYEYIPSTVGGNDGDLYAEGYTNSLGKFATSVAPGHIHIYADYNGTQKDTVVNVENDVTVVFTFDLIGNTVETRTEQYADTSGTQFENSTVGQDLPLPNASEWWQRNKGKVKFILLIAGLIIGVFLILYLLALGIGGVRKAWKKALRSIVIVPFASPLAALTSDQVKYLAIGIGAGLFIALLLLLMFRRVIIATRVFVIEDREPD